MTPKLQTALGETLVHRVGKGRPTLVFHGGPGFDHVPFARALSGQVPDRELIFFDQLGCGGTKAASPPVTAAATFEHAAAVLDAFAMPDLHVIAHAWGALVAVAALALRPTRRVREALFVNPVPIEGSAYSEMRAALAARIPPAIAAEVQRLIMAGVPGGEAFALLTPFYVASAETVVPRMDLSAMTYVTVDGSLGAFDFAAAVPQLGRLRLIRGEKDHVEARWLGPVLAAAEEDVVLPNVAHYPFFEDRPAFAAAIRRLAR